MKARDVMTAELVSVPADTPTRQVAQLLLEKGVSAVPVVDPAGAPIGIVSEGDLIGRDENDRAARRDWWLKLAASDEKSGADFVTRMLAPERRARDVMTGPVVTVTEDTDAREIAHLLASYRIKRVPVVREGRVVGIVSRADLLRAFAAEQPAPGEKREGGRFAEALAKLDERFLHPHEEERPKAPPAPAPAPPIDADAAKFQTLAAGFEEAEIKRREEALAAAGEQRKQRVEELEERHVSDDMWRALVEQARRAAEHGEREFLLLRAPSALMSDGGRAININEADWPATLRGEAAEIYLRWERDLRPRGFHLGVRIVDYPGGKPGDVGFFLSWAQ